MNPRQVQQGLTPLLRGVLLLALVPGITAMAGCRLYFGNTEVYLRDPTKASLYSQADPARAVLPDGRGPLRVTLATGLLQSPERDTRVPYSIDAVREASGAIDFDDGYRRVIVTADGAVRSLRDDDIPPIDLNGDRALIPMCADAAMKNGRLHRSYGECNADAKFRGVLATPWDNVVQIRTVETTGVTRGTTVVLTLIYTVLLGAPGSTLTVLGATSAHDDPKRVPCLVAGSLLLGLTATTVGLLVPGIITPSRTKIIYPAPAPR